MIDALTHVDELMHICTIKWVHIEWVVSQMISWMEGVLLVG